MTNLTKNYAINIALKLIVLMFFLVLGYPSQSLYYKRADTTTKACMEYVPGGSYISHHIAGVKYHKTFSTLWSDLRNRYKPGDSLYIMYDPNDPDYLYPKDFPDVYNNFIKEDIFLCGICLFFIIVLFRGLNKDPYPWHIRQKLKKWYESW